MIKLKLGLLIIFGFASAASTSMTNEIEYGLEHYTRLVLLEKFNQVEIRNHTKAPSLNIRFMVPSSWSATESSRPQTIQKYGVEKIPDGLQFLVLAKSLKGIIKKKDSVSSNDALEELALALVPSESLVIGKKLISLDNQKGFGIDYKNHHESAGVTYYLHTYTYTTVYKDDLIALSFFVSSDSFENVSIKMKYYRPIISKVLNSVIFSDKPIQSVSNIRSVSSTAPKPAPKMSVADRFIIMMIGSFPMLAICYLIISVILRNKIITLDKIELIFGFVSGWLISAEVYYLFGLKFVENNIGIFMLPLSISFTSILIIKNYKIKNLSRKRIFDFFNYD